MARAFMTGMIIATMMLAQGVRAEQNYCEELNGLATSIMTAKQKGVSAVKAMKVAKDSKLFRSMVMQAYQSPRFTTERYQSKAISEFANEWYMACLEAEG